MGSWGPGLYSDDDALDLKGLIAQLLKLPISVDKLLTFAREHSGIDEPLFSLVVADLLEKKGLRHSGTFSAAASSIRSGADIDRLRDLDMSEADLRKRRKMLGELATRLDHPRKEVARKIMKKKAPLVFSKGSVVRFPMCGAGPADIYTTKVEIESANRSSGWGAFHVFDVGYMFDFCPWLGVRHIPARWLDCPSFEEIEKVNAKGWVIFGLLNQNQCRKCRLEKVGEREVAGPVPPLPPGHTGPLEVVLRDVALTTKLRAGLSRRLVTKS